MRVLDSFRSFALLGAVLLVAWTSTPCRAESCSITGPAFTCGAPVELCAPTGDWLYYWTGPNQFMSEERCITVSDTGRYTLMVYNPWTGAMMDPCDHVLSAAAPLTSSISGPSSVCPGSTVQLCGPDGNLGYEWTCPDGSASTDQCVNASGPGTWTLVVTDLVSGCVSAPASHDVAFTVCDTPPPPPPPPPPSVLACPRTASFWARQCQHGMPGAPVLDPTMMAGVAACVDEHSAAFAWVNATDGLCKTLRSTSDVRARTYRQFAAVLANMCAGQLDAATLNGRPIRLDPGTALSIEGAPATVGEWVSQADAQLAGLVHARLNGRDTREAYRSILSTAWMINHGRGIGAVCPKTTRTLDSKRGFADGDDDVLEPDDRSLEMALDETPVDGGAVAFERAWPNPFATTTRFAFVLPREAEVSVAVHDLSGRIVRVLVRGAWSAGRHELIWDGTDSGGGRAAAGVYFIRATVGGERIQSQMTLLR
jgi:hypothetical protein